MEFIQMGSNKAMGNAPLKFLPSQLSGLKIWTRFNTGITVTGSGVSQWDDQSGNGNHLKQATDANRMTKEADGSILGNGVDQFLKADAFTFNQPEMIYALVRQVSWTDNDGVFDGNALNSGLLKQRATSPNIAAFAGGISNNNSDLTIGSYGVVIVGFNGASSFFSVNNGIGETFNAGSLNMGGFTLGAKGDASLPGNVQYKELVVLDEFHDAITQQRIINYLAQVGGLSI